MRKNRLIFFKESRKLKNCFEILIHPVFPIRQGYARRIHGNLISLAEKACIRDDSISSHSEEVRIKAFFILCFDPTRLYFSKLFAD